MRVLQHFTDPAKPPVGVWWVGKDNEVHSSYIAGAEAEEDHAAQVMLLKFSKSTWDEFFDALEQITPQISGWESVDASISPQEYLAMVQHLTKKAAV